MNQNKLKITIKQVILYYIIFFAPSNSILAAENYDKNNFPETCTCSRVSDSLTLVDFYQALNGFNWTNKWDLNQPIDTWYGVSLNSEEECVVKIDLDGTVDAGFTFQLFGNNLTGQLPKTINLPLLERLELAGNSGIKGGIPNFEGMPNLIILDLREDTLGGEIPTFQFLPNLEELYLGKNNLVGEIPDLSLVTPKLRNLNFQFNNLEGEIPNYNLPFLEVLDLSYNQITGLIPDFQGIPNLLMLYLLRCDFRGGIPNFTNMPNLQKLELGGNSSLGGEIPDFNLPLLRSLGCESCGLIGTIPDFSYLDSLRKLDLRSNSNLKGPIPNFTKILQLTNLLLDGADIKGNLPSFQNLTNLIGLSLGSCNLTGKIPSWNHFSNTISAINLFNNNLIDSIPESFEYFKNLVSLNVENNNLEFLPAFNKININFGTNNWSGLRLGRNKFTFEDILKIDTLHFLTLNKNDLILDSTRYHLQKNIEASLIEGERCSDVWIDLKIDSTVSTNIYTWIKIGKDTTVIDSTNKFLARNIDIGDAYEVMVTNPFFPGFILKSDLFTIQIGEDKCGRCPERRNMEINLENNQICSQTNTLLQLGSPEDGYFYQAFSNEKNLSDIESGPDINIAAPEKSGWVKVRVQDLLTPTCILELYDSVFIEVSDLNVDTSITPETLGLSDGIIALCIKDGIGNINITSNQGIITKEMNESCAEFYNISDLISGNYDVTISDEIGCQLELDLFVPPNSPRIKLAITPNNDGINDFLFLDLLEGGSYEENTLYIFNNWGKIIHQIHNYHNENNNWNGWVNGKLLPIGNYYFQLDIGIDQPPLKGFFTLKK